MLSKNEWATSGFQRLSMSLQNGSAPFFESDCQVFRVDNNLYAGRQAHQIICIRQSIRFVEIIDTQDSRPSVSRQVPKLPTCRSPTANTLGASRRLAHTSGQS